MSTDTIAIHLVRHARAFERDAAAWPDDSRRPLTQRGRERFAKLARHLGRILPRVDLLESSGFTRAWQTALLLHSEAGWPAPVRFDALESDRESSIPAMLRSLAAMRGIGSVAWVGHEPQLGQLASALLCGTPDGVDLSLRKGAVLRIEIALDRSVAPRLAWMIDPRLLRRR